MLTPDEHEPRPAVSLAREIEFRPLVLPACAFVAGILLGEHAALPSILVVTLAAALVVAIPLVYFFTRGGTALCALVVVLCWACGFLRCAWVRAGPAPDDVSRLVPAEGALLRVRGLVASRPMRMLVPADRVFHSRDIDRTSFDVEVDSAETVEGWQPASGTVRVSVMDNATDLAYGDRLEILSRFTRARGPTSPGEFDWRVLLERRGVRLRTTLESRAELTPVLAHHQGNYLVEMANSLGARLSRVIDRGHDPREAGLLRCILLGERSAVDPAIDQDFRQAGLSDLLAVSGLHVVILLGGLAVVLRFLLVPPRVIAWVVIAAAALYAGMASFQPPVVRAAVVAGMVALGVLVRRRHDMLNSLAASALVLLVANPHEVFSAGFQLTFCAVLGLVGLAPAIQRFLRPRLGFKELDRLPGAHHGLRIKAGDLFVSTLSITAAAWLASQPLVAWHFQILNPAVILISMLLVPVFTVILLGSFLALIVELAVGAFPAAWASGGLTRLLEALSDAGSRFPGAYVHFPSPPAWVLVVYYAMLVLVAIAPALGLRRRIPAAALLAVLVVLVGREVFPHRSASSELVVLDVGQGSATLVCSREGHAALVDVGTTSTRDIARSIVIPYLVRERVFTLDAVVLSHADTDHTSGLPTLVDNFRVKKVLLCETFKYTHAGLEVERWLIEHGVAYEFVGAGDIVALGSTGLEVLHPPRAEGIIDAWLRRPGKRRVRIEENERSAVVRGVTPGGTFVVFGDVSGEGVKRLESVDADLSADVVVAPHHGGSSGGEALAPVYHWPVVLFSAGPGFVKPPHLDAYRSTGARTLVTADTGTIAVRFGKRISVESFRDVAVED